MDESTTYFAEGAARLIGCSGRTIGRHCAEHGIGRRLGRYWVLTDADIERLREVVQPRRGHPGVEKHDVS